jgi:hypothetical protein
MSVLNWKHHTLIQALMSRGPLTEDELFNIFADVTGKNPSKYFVFSSLFYFFYVSMIFKAKSISFSVETGEN